MMNEKLNLSIIIPVYNTENYLADCLDSILSQDIEKYEIIIINDGSTDKSKDIILKYIEKHPFIKYHEQKNMGQGAARNMGIDLAAGKYIYFMDSDDILIKGKLKEMLKMIIKNNYDAIFFDGKSFSSDYLRLNDDDQSYSRKKEYGYYAHGEYLLSDLSNNNDLIVSPCLFIIKAQIIKENRLYFPIGYKHEDEFFTATLFLLLRDCYHTKDTVFLRRIRENSTMTNKNKIPSFLGYVHILNCFHRFLGTFRFETKNGQEAYMKKMSDVTKFAYKSYSQVDNKQSIKKEYEVLNKLTKKYKYFNLKTGIYITLSKEPFLLSNYEKIVKILKVVAGK